MSDEATRTFTMTPIGVVRGPYHDVSEIPKGPGAEHRAEGTLELRADLEPGLADIEGFSHLFVLWVFDRSEGCELVTRPPLDPETEHGVFTTRSPYRPNPIALTVVELLGRDGPRLQRARRRHARRHADPRHQAVPVRSRAGEAASRVGGRGGSEAPIGRLMSRPADADPTRSWIAAQATVWAATGFASSSAWSQSVCGARFLTNQSHTISRYVCGFRPSCAYSGRSRRCSFRRL